MKLSQLTAAPYNPRRINDEALDGLTYSMRTYGDLACFVVNTQTGNMVCAHQRTKAAPSDGEIVIVDRYDPPTPVGTVAEGYVLIYGERFKYREVAWDEAKEKAANIAANSPTISGQFTDGLGALLEEVKIEMPEAYEALSFDDLDIPDPILDDSEEEQPVPAPPVTPIVKRGDIFRLGRHKIMCGDSTTADDVNALLGGGKPILMVTDPPYGVEYDADWRNHAKRADGSVIGGKAIGVVTNDDRAGWADSYSLFAGDVAYVWHAGRFSSVIAEDLSKCGFEVVNQIIWGKSNFAIGRGDYHWQHEPCWYAIRKGKNHNWQGSRSETTLWEINKPSKSETGHSTQKPLECMSRPIQNNTSVGQGVYDPFLGSGTTLIAAHKLNRVCYGLEISPAYVEVIIRRFAENCADEHGNVDFEHVNGELTLDEIVANVNTEAITSESDDE